MRALLAAGLTIVSLGACGGPSPQAPDGPAAASVKRADHYAIVDDETGAYVCVLRRGDDLADLRAAAQR